jgi:CheY-like chemotaxis protein
VLRNFVNPRLLCFLHVATHMDSTVLVVDDDLDSRTLLATLLTVCGYAVVTASNGAEALVVARHHRPALILLDLMMPVMDGEQFRGEQLKDASLRDIPVFLVTATHNAEQVARKLGVQSCIAKPILFDRLMQAVAGVLPPRCL